MSFADVWEKTRYLCENSNTTWAEARQLQRDVDDRMHLCSEYIRNLLEQFSKEAQRQEVTQFHIELLMDHSAINGVKITYKDTKGDWHEENHTG